MLLVAVCWSAEERGPWPNDGCSLSLVDGGSCGIAAGPPMDALSLVDGGSCGIAAGPTMDVFSLVDGGSGVGSHACSASDLLQRHYRIDVAAVYLSFFGRSTG